tara:strand:+ start:104 stop:655 length:552 start_codon:yes stop_codon:yes gene_type:complete
MTRAELKELTVEERKERTRLQKVKNYKKNKDARKEKVAENNKKFRKNNPEYHKEYLNNNPEYRKYLQEYIKKYRIDNPDYFKEYYEEKTEYFKEYRQSPNTKKIHTIGTWKYMGLQETKEELDIIYDLYLNQELCYSCNVKLTRDGINCNTQACMDHDHNTNRFRQICCRKCNTHDYWLKYWC